MRSSDAASGSARDDLLRSFAGAYEQVIGLAVSLPVGQSPDWGPREVVAHLAGWELMANVRLPHIVAGMAPFEDPDEGRQKVMDDALNATMVAMAGSQSLAELTEILRHAYRRTVDYLQTVPEDRFQPGDYVYERTRGVIQHCAEHAEAMRGGPA